MDYITKDTEYPTFVPCPSSLLTATLSSTAKLAYLHLLQRALLSRSNDWIDEAGRVYIVYPLDKLGSALGKSVASITRAMRELEDAKMIERKHLGLSRPNHIYVLIEQCKNEQPRLRKNELSGYTKMSSQTAQKRATNYNNNNYNKENYTTHTIPDITDFLTQGDDQ